MPKKSKSKCPSTCATCGQAYPPMTEDAKLACLLLTAKENRYNEIVTNAPSNIVFNWHTLSLADKESWLAVVKLAREKLTLFF